MSQTKEEHRQLRRLVTVLALYINEINVDGIAKATLEQVSYI